MALELDGKVVRVLQEQTGEGRNGTWKKQEFIVETLGEYPKRICFESWQEKTEIIKSLNDGDRVKVSFSLESREYNEKWYTNVRAWKIEKLVANGTPPPATGNQEQNAKKEEKVQNEEPPLPENKDEDDLPF